MRRALLLVVTAAVLGAGCVSGGSGGSEERVAPRPTTTEAPPTLAPPIPWKAGPGEDVVAVKAAATGMLAVLANYAAGQGTVPAAQARLRRSGLSEGLAQAGAALLRKDASSAVDILYPQLAGYSPQSASVMVVARFRTLSGRTESSTTRVVQVAVTKGSAGWAATGLAPVDVRPATGAGEGTVASLLRNPSLELSDTTRADLLAGTIYPQVLDVLTEISRTYRLSVTVFATGHPVNVFQTNRMSNHTRGRAVDIWAVDGVPVAAQRAPGSALEALGRRLLQLGVTELGGPWDLDGPGSRSFTDLVHRDHLHIGFRLPSATRPAP